MGGFAIIPEDLRARKDLTIDKVGRVVEIRKRVEKLDDLIDAADAKAKALRQERANLIAEEELILGKAPTA